jgi:hypothetical protein
MPPRLAILRAAIGVESFMNQSQHSEPEPTEAQVPMDDLVTTAERELAAFVSAVSASLGPDQAGLAADQWIEELLSLDFSDGLRIPDWRQITITAASLLAKHSATTLCGRRVDSEG